MVVVLVVALLLVLAVILAAAAPVAVAMQPAAAAVAVPCRVAPLSLGTMTTTMTVQQAVSVAPLAGMSHTGGRSSSSRANAGGSSNATSGAGNAGRSATLTGTAGISGSSSSSSALEPAVAAQMQPGASVWLGGSSIRMRSRMYCQSVMCAENEECAVCLERPAAVHLKPCGHTVLCAPCFGEVMRKGACCPTDVQGGGGGLHFRRFARSMVGNYLRYAKQSRNMCTIIVYPTTNYPSITTFLSDINISVVMKIR